MYYLRKQPHEATIPALPKTDGSFIPERKYVTDDRAIYVHPNYNRYYRGKFRGIDGKYQGMEVYQCKTLKGILQLRQSTFNYSGEWFDVYDENGQVDISGMMPDKDSIYPEE
ncbi:hypothetical protein [Acetobacterium wieringae]|uniref:Uncharacterized protein n=1 Tax=Acetobacterium wieringae TaxID=52694 RepID=A0A1F2PL46_9FIRM|nr:hypothetical protein [Acetobacterium wieringae]OFV72098.1 hypothetical protein ACWI_03480 [Acetobacterium wieringae]